jgi:hypothetical protein
MTSKFTTWRPQLFSVIEVTIRSKKYLHHTGCWNTYSQQKSKKRKSKSNKWNPSTRQFYLSLIHTLHRNLYTLIASSKIPYIYDIICRINWTLGPTHHTSRFSNRTTRSCPGTTRHTNRFKEHAEEEPDTCSLFVATENGIPIREQRTTNNNGIAIPSLFRNSNQHRSPSSS